ncbi:hypothetical protein K469DRAFT_702167 [Zopfia rhizophila CBS 207.26]|uniref:F-box domain-containing protein n=1 Tax=Zopfia rhizophila CBS 207.26 TaxID=1314779 RepID=A0A6A6D7M9_9PEZI|nr:hypothetical protein K469DRAFT_702167 [Zopfia rhizophila CBS 207.26]
MPRLTRSDPTPIGSHRGKAAESEPRNHHHLQKKDQESALLRLPTEVRDIIYEFALTKGVVDVVEVGEEEKENQNIGEEKKENQNIFRLECDDPHVQEVNQLKYVCQQLHKETSGLGLKWNTLLFRQHLSPSVCIRFLRACCDAQKDKIKEMIINIYSERTDSLSTSAASELEEFDRSHPNIKINVVVTRVRLSVVNVEGGNLVLG